MIKNTEKMIEDVNNKLKATKVVSSKITGNSPSLTAVAIQLVNDFFEELITIFPAYKQNIPDAKTLSNVKKTWVKAFQENGIKNISQLKLGLKRARASSEHFFPSVGKFCAWCAVYPEDIGLPDFDSAFKEASRKIRFSDESKWSYPAVRVAASAVGKWYFANNTEKKSLALFKKEYDKAIERQINGEDLSQLFPAIEEKKEIKTSSPDVVNGYTTLIRSKLKKKKIPVFENASNSFVRFINENG